MLRMVDYDCYSRFASHAHNVSDSDDDGDDDDDGDEDDDDDDGCDDDFDSCFASHQILLLS